MARAVASSRNPTFFQLQGDRLTITYATTSFAGTPQFSYQDANTSKVFSGTDIRTSETELGTLVTVTLVSIPDLGSTIFTLVVPNVILSLFETVQIETIGITTIHRTSIIGPPHGQNDFYTTHDLTGAASFVEF
jgi:hypothetical protein